MINMNHKTFPKIQFTSWMLSCSNTLDISVVIWVGGSLEGTSSPARSVPGCKEVSFPSSKPGLESSSSGTIPIPSLYEIVALSSLHKRKV